VDVVAGRADAGVGDLLHLIHEVNPTGRELPSEEEARLYGLKAGLQSLLLRRFGEQIVVRAESADARVVSLAHRSAPFDACHAVVSELDEDARSWVRRQLDEGPGGQPEEPGPRLHAGRMPAATGGPAGAQGGGGEPAPGEDDRDLVRQARAALEGYDYEEARVRLLEAFEHSAGGLAAARLLLELLVEHLGADQDALDLEDGLSADSSADHDVRALLAVAAARLAQPDRAQHLLKGTRGPRVGAAHAALAQGALQAGDETAATRWIRKLREGAPDHMELARLEEAREALRGEQRGPLEAALTQTHRTGTEEEAERQAQEILDRWPESRIATQVLHEIEGARTHRESQRLLGSAEEALLRGEVAEARRLHRKAVSRQGPSAAKTDPDELLARIERTEAEERTRGDATRVAGVGKALSGDSRSEALLDYLSLSSGLRSAVREASGTEILDWLEQTGVTGSGTRAHASVEAVLALEEACALLDAGRPAAGPGQNTGDPGSG